LSRFPQGSQIAFGIIPTISTLPQPLKDEVRIAFADAIQVVWHVFTGIGGIGLLSSLLMKGLSRHTSVDRDRGRVDTKEGNKPDEDLVWATREGSTKGEKV
jgi:hypothetical protein